MSSKRRRRHDDDECAAPNGSGSREPKRAKELSQRMRSLNGKFFDTQMVCRWVTEQHTNAAAHLWTQAAQEYINYAQDIVEEFEDTIRELNPNADVSADANGFTAKHRVPAATPIPSPLFQQAPPSSTTSSALFAPPGKSLASPAGGAGSLFGAFGANVSPDKDPSSSSFAFPTGKETVAATGSAEASSSMFSFGPAASSGASMPLGGGAGHNNTGGVGVAAIAGGLLGNAGGGWGGFGGSTPAFGSGGSTAPLFGGVQSGATAGGRLFGAGASSSSSIFASAGTAQGGTAHRFAALPSEEDGDGVGGEQAEGEAADDEEPTKNVELKGSKDTEIVFSGKSKVAHLEGKGVWGAQVIGTLTVRKDIPSGKHWLQVNGQQGRILLYAGLPEGGPVTRKDIPGKDGSPPISSMFMLSLHVFDQPPDSSLAKPVVSVKPTRMRTHINNAASLKAALVAAGCQVKED